MTPRPVLLSLTAALALTTALPAAADTIRVGMSGGYFPFPFVKQDKLQGFEVDMWNQIGERTGYKVEFVTASFSGLFGMLETGRVDTISNQITITDERKANIDFSDPYYDSLQSLLVRADSRGRLRTLPLLVLRHAKAKPRSSWSRAEQERPLAATGRRQALAVEGLVAAWVPDRLVSSPWRRCVETLAPLVKSSRLPLKTKGAFTETTAREKPKKTRKVMAELMGRSRPLVVCTHRPVLPTLFEVVEDAAAGQADRVLRALPTEDPWLRPGAVLVAHRALDLDGDVVAVEVYDPWDD